MSIIDSRKDPALLLKSNPPRRDPRFLDRERLKLGHLERTGAQVLPLLAPTGFGKTSQLVSWRREVLARGASPFWYSADDRDNPARLVRGLTHSAREVCGKRAFGDSIVRWLFTRSDPREAITGWLAEVAGLATEVWLMLDDVDLMPTRSRTQILEYMLGNLPANLHIALAARPTSALMASGTFSTAPVAPAITTDLRFTVSDTLAVLSKATGSQCSPEIGVRVHELADGWPLGVRLAAVALSRSGDMRALLSTASVDIRRYFLSAVIDCQPEQTIGLLIALACFEVIHPDLCAAMTGDKEMGKELLRLYEETPLISRAEGGEWMKLHPLAREGLRARWNELPIAVRQDNARKASAWYATHGMYDAAAEQSFLSGDVDAAITLAEQHSTDMTIQGRNAAVLAWYDRLSPQELRQHPGFWSAAAWALAMSDRNGEEKPLLHLILAIPNLSVARRFETALIFSTAAGFADRLRDLAALPSDWPEAPPEAFPSDVVVYHTGVALNALYRGQPELARRHFGAIPDNLPSPAYWPVSYGYVAYGIGLSYAWEGRFVLAAETLGPALAQAEKEIDRYSQLACMIAAILAHACLESGYDAQAHTLLAGKLDFIDHFGVPEVIMAAHRTLARLADKDGRQDVALDLLGSLRAIGESRGMIRLQVAALYELVQLHVLHGRTDTAAGYSSQLHALASAHSQGAIDPYSDWINVYSDLARAQTALAPGGNRSLDEILPILDHAALAAERIRRGAESVEIRFLRAEALRRHGKVIDAQSVYEEAVSLAHASGMNRILHEHGIAPGSSLEPFLAESAPLKAPVSDKDAVVRAAGILTLKEREVLTLLCRSLSNKEIALAMGIGEQTIKWHIKNLFAKLNAGTRKHAVARARLLGLVDL